MIWVGFAHGSGSNLQKFHGSGSEALIYAQCTNAHIVQDLPLEPIPRLLDDGIGTEAELPVMPLFPLPQWLKDQEDLLNYY